MSRRRSQARIKSDKPIIERILQIKSEHPLWGYRRVWAYMRYRDNQANGKNRVYRLMKENRLLVDKDSKLKAKRVSTRPKPKAGRPNQYWGIDMTKIKLPSYGWIYLHLVLDWYTKEIIGVHLSFQSKRTDWENTLNQAVNNRYPDGILNSKKQPCLISDNGCQPTSQKFMQMCSNLKIKQIFTTWNNPKGNADTERVFRTLKEDLIWPYDWDNPFELEQALQKWVHDYNTDFPHQSLKYTTPSEFYRNQTKAKEDVLLLA